MRARDNPFRSTRLGHLRFRHPELSNDALLARLDALDLRAAIVGPHGSGKTTLLRELAEHCEARGLRVRRRFLNADAALPGVRSLAREAAALGPGDALLFDGAGHLPPRHWRGLLRASRAVGALLVTAHAPGLLPTLVETRVDLALLVELSGELLGPASAGIETRLETLHRVHRGNLHEVFLALYDLAAGNDPCLAGAGPADVQARGGFVSLRSTG